MTWANGRQLTRARASTFGTTFDVYYSYDGDGLRTGKSGTRNTEYIILGGTYIGERTTINGTEYLITYIYDANGSILGIDINGTAYYFVKNLQGDVTAMVTEFGEIIGKYTYDGYGYCYPVKDTNGNTITDETHPAMLNPFRYRGYYYDVETKFYYLNTRYYDPEACRFINADGLVSTGQGFDGYNMFAYCSNNPSMYVDIKGRCPVGFIGPCPGPERCSYFKNTPNWYQQLNEIPSCATYDFPSLPTAVSVIPDIVLGSTEVILENQTINTTVIIEDNWIRYLPEPGIEVKRYSTVPKALNTISDVLTVATMSWDIVDTWVSNDNNTTGQRIIKSATIAGGTAAGVGVGALATTVVTTCITGGWGFVPCVLIYGGITVAGGLCINDIQNSVYDYYGIE